METDTNQHWIPAERIAQTVQLEPALILIGLAVVAWIIYRFLLKKVSARRHQNLRKLFANLVVHIVIGSLLSVGYWSCQRFHFGERVCAQLGLFSLIWGTVVFIKICRILVFEYLFLKHMREGVPLLLVNLITLILSASFITWIITDVFGVRLAPVLATSAIFSLVLGLALQDTLGNLFSGVALQFDKPYELGDWIEIQSVSNTPWIGKVVEISWRATLLQGFGEEMQIIPNRVIAQSQISNYSTKSNPPMRTQLFRLAYSENIPKVKEILLRAIALTPGILIDPAPLVLLRETTESWMGLKLIYYIEDFGAQYLIGDRVLAQCIVLLRENNIEFATTRLSIEEKTKA